LGYAGANRHRSYNRSMTRALDRSTREAWIVSAVRTPVGRYGGALARVRPDDLAAIAIKAAVERSGIDPGALEDVILGCANQAGEDNRNVARMAALLAGLPVEIAGQTVNRLCGSGLQAINSAAHAIMVGDGDAFVAGGVESMTRAPYVMAKPESPYDRGNREMYDTTLGWRFTNPRLAQMHHPYSMGETGENVAERCIVTREEQDEFALRSHERAVAAIEEGRFTNQIVPVMVPQPKGEAIFVERDEHPRADTSLEALARLRPAFREGGTVTAGNSSGINDGASATVMVSRDFAEREGLKPMARVLSTAVAGVDPAVMGLGPIPATRKALERAGLNVGDLDLIELNEAFASQSIVVMRELGLDPERVNVNGGAIALGHPLGMSGARLITMLSHELGRTGKRYGLATMCIGVGQGIATIIERIEEPARTA
jgi:3-oxoadipyl-CoA thiolase